MEKSKSIINPKKAVPNAVENTIKAVVSALIDPINLTQRFYKNTLIL